MIEISFVILRCSPFKSYFRIWIWKCYIRGNKFRAEVGKKDSDPWGFGSTTLKKRSVTSLGWNEMSASLYFSKFSFVIFATHFVLCKFFRLLPRILFYSHSLLYLSLHSCCFGWRKKREYLYAGLKNKTSHTGALVVGGAVSVPLVLQNNWEIWVEDDIRDQ